MEPVLKVINSARHQASLCHVLPFYFSYSKHSYYFTAEFNTFQSQLIASSVERRARCAHFEGPDLQIDPAEIQRSYVHRSRHQKKVV